MRASSGGLSAGELVVHLCVSSFPKNEWRTRVGEAVRGMKL